MYMSEVGAVLQGLACSVCVYPPPFLLAKICWDRSSTRGEVARCTQGCRDASADLRRLSPSRQGADVRAVRPCHLLGAIQSAHAAPGQRTAIPSKRHARPGGGTDESHGHGVGGA